MLSRRPYRQVIDGVPRCPMVIPEIFRKGISFRAAKGDVVQSSYPKSGTNWVQYITQLILNGGKAISSYNEFTRNLRAIEYVDSEGWFRMTKDLSTSKFEDGTFEEFFEPFVEGDLGYGSYFDHVASGYALKDGAERVLRDLRRAQ
ncbi:hypothetical protein MTO96_030045 [Rhipicephalus appendiculatus]